MTKQNFNKKVLDRFAKKERGNTSFTWQKWKRPWNAIEVSLIEDAVELARQEMIKEIEQIQAEYDQDKYSSNIHDRANAKIAMQPLEELKSRLGGGKMIECKNCGEPLAKLDIGLIMERLLGRNTPFYHAWFRLPITVFGKHICLLALKKSRTGCNEPEPKENVRK